MGEDDIARSSETQLKVESYWIFVESQTEPKAVLGTVDWRFGWRS